MITVNDDWVIDVDDRNYIVCKNKPRKAKGGVPMLNKSGEMMYDPLAFFSTLGGAIDYIIQKTAQEKLIETSDVDLKGAIRIIQTSQKEIADIIKQAIPDAKTYFT